MEIETQAAESSTAVQEQQQAQPEPKPVEADRGPLVNLTAAERQEYRKTGKLPEAPKPADAAPAIEQQASEDDEEAESESAPEADAGTKQQENTAAQSRKQSTAERFRVLTEHNKELKAELERLRKTVESGQKPAETSEQPKAAPRTYQEWRQGFKANEWDEQYAKEHPDATYEDIQAARSDYMLDARDYFREQERTMKAQADALNAAVTEAHERYGEAEFNEIMAPTIERILQDKGLSTNLKGRINRSKVLPHLIYYLGHEPGELDKFIRTATQNEDDGVDWIVLTESLIRDELGSKSKSETHQPKPQDPPAKPQSGAPKPATEIGGRAASPGDELESAAKANDFRRFKAEANRRALAQLKG